MSLPDYVLPGYVPFQVMSLPGCVSYGLCPFQVESFQVVSFRVVSIPGCVLLVCVLAPPGACLLLGLANKVGSLAAIVDKVWLLLLMCAK